MSHDPKQGEREYYARIGPEGIRHSLTKPFGDEFCAQYLAQLTALFSLLPPPPARIVDFGCGTGWLSFLLAQRGYEVLGVDISPEAVAAAGASARERGLPHARFVAHDYESFDGGGQFDFGVFFDALHHAESELDALRCAYAALKPGGCLITFEPGRGHHATAASQHAIQEFKVHEKDMPTAHIVRTGRAAGFRQHLVLPHPHKLNRVIYHAGYFPAASRRELVRRRIDSLYRALKHLLRWEPEPGIVLLQK